MLGEENFDCPIQIDWPHCSPQQLRDGRCRAFIARIHHYQVKERILHLVRSKSLQHDGNTICIFPDLTADTIQW